jgi:hypothetical protein
MPFESLCLVAELVESLPAFQPCQVIKERLMIAECTPADTGTEGNQADECAGFRG